MTLRGIQCLWGEGWRDGGYYLLANYHLFKDKPRGAGGGREETILGGFFIQFDLELSLSLFCFCFSK